MKAIQIGRHGDHRDATPRELAVPSPAAGQILVAVEAAGINPSDLASIAGAFPHSSLPRIVGRDFAGRVVEGPPALIGAAVWGTGGDLGVSRDGTFAEYIVLQENEVSRRPASLSAEEAAVVGVPFVTAWTALELGALEAGQSVAVAGAAGAVGSAAVQLAGARGAKVIPVTRANAAELVDLVKRATGGRGCDVALNGVGAALFQPLVDATALGGRQVVYSILAGREVALDLFHLYRQGQSVRGLNTVLLGAAACARILDQLAPLFDAGTLHAPAIAERHALTDAPRAFESTAKHMGKVVLVTDRAPP